MSNLYRLTLSLFLFLSQQFTAQGFGAWSCDYATIDADPNATGNRTISVAAYGENDFAALVADYGDSCYYVVGYKDADSTSGRLGAYEYSGTGQVTVWINGFDQALTTRAKDMEHRKVGDEDLLFVASNDPDRNILVFKMTADSIETYPWRMSTLQNAFDPVDIWSIDIDDAGRVYVTTEGDTLNPSMVYVFESPDVETAWAGAHTAAPLQTITLPDNGDARGIAVSPDGTALYVSNSLSRKVYCYIGDADNGYELFDGFSFEVTEDVSDDTETIPAIPWGLNFMPDNNILFACISTDYENNSLGYSYGKVYLLNPNNGDELGIIDVAAWNFDQTGSYNSNGPGNVSGYASPYNCDFDDMNNVYICSYYGWAIDKWSYNSDLPVIDLVITSVEQDFSQVPSEFMLSQNYPNPFNPTTTISFSVPETSEITLSIYSLTGELISEIINSQTFNSGVYNVSFDATAMASGMYIYKLDNGKQSISKKMTLIK